MLVFTRVDYICHQHPLVGWSAFGFIPTLGARPLGPGAWAVHFGGSSACLPVALRPGGLVPIS